MLFVPSSQLTEGMCVAEDVCDHQGRILIARGQRIGHFHIARLRKFGIHSLFIDPHHGEKPAPPVKSSLRKQCEAVFSAACPKYAGASGPLLTLDAGAVRSAADSLVDSLLRARKSVVTLSTGPELDDRETQHAVNVAALAVALGIDFRLPNDTLREVGSAMLLHDVGLMLLPKELTERTVPPNPEEIQQLKKHTVLGYDYVLKTGALSPIAASLLLSHHERLNGSGYPQALRADKLTPAIKIVAVAEAFDSLTSGRFAIPAVLPDAAIAWMLLHSDTLFDKEIVLALSQRIALYPNGSAVRLTTGETGIVAGTLPRAPRRPIVLVHIDGKGRTLATPMIVDLTKETGRAIARSAPTMEMLQESRATGIPVSTIDPILAAVG
jgi:hypothetical protein